MQRERAAAVSLLRVITPRRRPSMTATTRRFDPTALENMLYLSFELGEGELDALVHVGLRCAGASPPRSSARSGRSASADRGDEGAARPGCELPRGELLRGGAGRLLAAPLPRGPRDREPGGGLFQHRGEPPEPAREDGPTRRRVAAGSPAAPPGREPEEGLRRGAVSHAGAGGSPASAPGAPGGEARPDSGHQPDEGAAREPGAEVAPLSWTPLRLG